jgi:hypothetical protein
MDRESLYEEYSARQKFEHELLNRRVSWLLTSQSLLFVAYGLGASKDKNLPPNFSALIALCGLASSLAALLGIFAAAWAKRRSWQDYLCLVGLIDTDGECRSAFQDRLDKLRQEWGVKTSITKLGLAPDLVFPCMFVVAWATLLHW